MSSFNPRVDIYIDSVAEFAAEILIHLRQLVHAACPDIVEDIKWGMPSFTYKGSILCGMAAFKKHCAFSFWLGAIMDDPHGVINEKIGKTSMGSFGKITSLKDLPNDDIIIEYIVQAAMLIEKGVKMTPTIVREKAPLQIPDYFLKALQKEASALAFFESLSYARKKDYLQWITEAKREETRNTRVNEAVDMLIERKNFNWKYEQKSKTKRQ